MYDDWADLSDFEKERSYEALNRIKTLIGTILQKYDITIPE